jgi:hypothetical protein
MGGMLVLYGALNLEPTVVPPFQIFGRDLDSFFRTSHATISDLQP